MKSDIMEENQLKEFSDLKSAYSYLEDNALNYEYPHQIGDIFRILRDKKHEEKNTDDEMKCQWEIDTFNFVTYNGDVKPHFSKATEQGEVTEFPSLSAFDDETYDYLSERLNSTSNPLLKSRYAHILWQSPRKHGRYAKTTIGAYLELIRLYEINDKEHPQEHYGLEVITAIRNAYFLARQSRDEESVNMVKTEIKRLIHQFDLNSSSAFALRANLIELMLNDKRVYTKEDFVDIENVCLQMAETLYKSNDILRAIDMFKLGEKISKKLGQNTESWTRRIAESYENMMNRTEKNNLMSLHFCSDALVYYKKIKDKSKIEGLEKKYSELKTSVEFHQFKTEIDLTKSIKQCKNIAKKIVKELPEDIIKILSLDKKLLPTYKEMQKCAEEQRKEHPIQDLFQSSIVDQSGHTVQYFTTDEEKKYHGILWHYKIHLEMGKIHLINAIFLEVIRQRKLLLSELISFFRKYSWFGRTLKKKFAGNQEIEFNWLNLLIPPLNEYFIQMDYFLASGNLPNFVLPIDSLTLKIEGLIRDMCNFSGVATFYFITDEKGRQIAREKDLGALLYEEKIKELFDEDDLLFFRFLLVEKAGYNLRHRIAHSLLLFQEYHVNFMHLLILTLLKLGKYHFMIKD